MRRLVLTLLIAAATAAPLVAQLPDARSLIARHDSLIGGREGFAQLRSMRVLGSFSVPAAGIETPLEILKVSPNRFVVRTTMGEGIEVLQGFDGHTAWSVRSGVGARILAGAEREALVKQADFFGDLHDLTQFRDVATTADTTFEGRRAWQVRYVRATPDTLYEYFDQELGLSLGNRVVSRSAFGRVEVRTLVGDYRVFGPLRLATTIVQRQEGVETIIRIGFVEFDRVRDADVTLPDPVRALIP